MEQIRYHLLSVIKYLKKQLFQLYKLFQMDMFTVECCNNNKSKRIRNRLLLWYTVQ